MENSGKSRIKKHREVSAARGWVRCEVKIPDQDVELIRSLAGLLKQGGKPAHLARQALVEIVPKKSQNLVDFFHTSPLAEYHDELDFSRDVDTGKPLDFS